MGGALLRRVPQVGENNFPLPWIPESSAADVATATVIRVQTSMVGADDSTPTSGSTSSLHLSSPGITAAASQPSARPTHTQTTHGSTSDAQSNKSLALAVTLPLGIALVLGIVAVVVLNRCRKPSRLPNNSSSTSSSKPIWREKFGLLRSNSTSTTTSTSSTDSTRARSASIRASSVMAGPTTAASHNHPYYAGQDVTPAREEAQHTTQEMTEVAHLVESGTEPGAVMFEAPPPPYINEPAPELPDLPSGLARLSYQHPPPPPTRPASELRISVQVANALRISAHSIGFPPPGSLPVSEEPPAHPPFPDNLGRWSYPHQEQTALAPPPASPEIDELRNSTLARFPVPPSIPAKSDQRPYTPPLQSLTVPQMQKMQYRNTSPELTSPTSPESPVWGHGFPDHPIRPSRSVRSFTSTLYSDTASVHSATVGKWSARPTPVITQGQGYFGGMIRSPSLPY